MKKTLFYITAASAILSLSSCAFFELDNYEAPSETLRGRVVDMDGNPVLTEQASEGIRVRFWDLTWEAQGHETLPVDFNCKPDGTFQNTKMFPGDYRVTVDGPFVPIVRDASDGTPIVNGAKEINIKEGGSLPPSSVSSLGESAGMERCRRQALSFVWSLWR